MENKKISTVMNRQLVCVSPSAKAATILKLIQSSNISFLPVVENGRLVGILNGEKLKSGTYNSILPFIERPLFVEKDSSIDHAIKYLLKHRLSRVPVVDSALGMKCIGTVSSSELLKSKKNKK